MSVHKSKKLTLNLSGENELGSKPGLLQHAGDGGDAPGGTTPPEHKDITLAPYREPTMVTEPSERPPQDWRQVFTVDPKMAPENRQVAEAALDYAAQKGGQMEGGGTIQGLADHDRNVFLTDRLSRTDQRGTAHMQTSELPEQREPVDRKYYEETKNKEYKLEVDGEKITYRSTTDGLVALGDNYQQYQQNIRDHNSLAADAGGRPVVNLNVDEHKNYVYANAQSGRLYQSSVAESLMHEAGHELADASHVDRNDRDNHERAGVASENAYSSDKRGAYMAVQKLATPLDEVAVTPLEPGAKAREIIEKGGSAYHDPQKVYNRIFNDGTGLAADLKNHEGEIRQADANRSDVRDYNPKTKPAPNTLEAEVFERTAEAARLNEYQPTPADAAPTKMDLKGISLAEVHAAVAPISQRQLADMSARESSVHEATTGSSMAPVVAPEPSKPSVGNAK